MTYEHKNVGGNSSDRLRYDTIEDLCEMLDLPDHE